MSSSLPNIRRGGARAAAFVAAAATASVLALAPATLRAQQQPSAPPPSPADSLRLTLAQAVERAVRASDETRLAAAQVEVTAAQLTTARAGVLPSLRLVGTYTHQIENARAQALGQIFNQPNTYNVYANVSQPLFQGGREFAALRAASRLRGAARLSAAEAREQITLDVESAYVQALFAERVLQIQTQNLTLASERVTQIEQLQGGGRAARYDVLRARVERANIEPLALQAANDREIALLDLKRLLQIPLATPIALATPIDTTTVQGVLASLGELGGGIAPASARLTGDATLAPSRGAPLAAARGGPPTGDLTPAAADTVTNFSPAQASLLPTPNRASVRAAELTARARRDAIAVARADLLPTVSVFFQTGYQAFPLSGFPTQLGSRDVVACAPGQTPAADGTCRQQNGGFFSDRQIGVQLSWALFDGLRTKGNIDLAQAQARVAEIQLNLERERVALDVARARAELARARAAFAASRQNSTEADEAFRLASLRFTRGLGTQLDVTDAQYALATARTNEARATYDIFLASAGLARALGRPLPVPGSGATTAPVRSTSGGGGTGANDIK
ncbi:MAG TPA: TolC family protein [Gemmatimonadaceae bacterium]|nr:TolC family protein [Gemmatimonadaceae bacterium]